MRSATRCTAARPDDAVIRVLRCCWQRDRDARAQFDATADRRFQFQNRRQLSIRSHNETLAVTATRVCNPDCAAFAIER
jgi:hypothetical protein